jgi:ADP-heptose:LPS heptosyltransferase
MNSDPRDAEWRRYKNPADVPAHRFVTNCFWRMFPGSMRRRWWLFRLGDLIARNWPVLKKRTRVLVIRMDGIGDMVLFRNSLDHYAQALGVEQKDILVVGCESWSPIAKEVFAGFRVYTINEHAFAKNLFYRFKVSLFVRCQGADVCVCDSYLRRAMMADSLVWVSHAKKTIVSLPYIGEANRSEFTYYLSQVDEIIDTGPYPTHEVVRHHRFVSALSSKDIAPVSPQINWRDAPAPIDGAYVILNPGSNEYGRRWPFSDYLVIAGRLLEKGLRPVFIGHAKENPSKEHLHALAKIDGAINMIGQTNLPQLLDLIRGAAAVLTNDTGPAHVSIALGAPTLVIVGGGHFGSFVPYPEGVRPDHARFVFYQMECYHCFWRCDKREDRKNSFPCVAAVTKDDVWENLSALLDKDSHG